VLIKIKLNKGHPYRQMYVGEHLIKEKFETIEIEKKFLETDEVNYWFKWEIIKKKNKKGK